MANESYVNNGPALLASGAGGADISWTVNGLADEAGRVSAQFDLGAVPRPYIITWSCEVQWGSAPVQYGTLDLYIASAPDTDPTQVTGGVGQNDAPLGSEDQARNLKYLGAVVAETGAANTPFTAAGIFTHYERYGSLVCYNDGGAAVNNTAANFRFDLQIRYIQGQ